MYSKYFNPHNSIIKMKKAIIIFLILFLAVPISDSRTRVYTTDGTRLDERMSAYLAIVMLKESHRDLLLQLLNSSSQNESTGKGNNHLSGFINPNAIIKKNRLVIKVTLTPENDIWYDTFRYEAPSIFSKEDVNSILKDLRKEILKMDPVICLVNPDLVRIKKEKQKATKIPDTIYAYSSFYFQKAVKESGAKTDKEKISF